MSIAVNITGRLGAEPEFKISSTGVAICNLRVVTNRRRKVGDAWEDYDTTWWAVSCFRQAAETAATFSKGQRVMLTGWAKERQWETKEGEKRSRIEVVAEDIAGIPKPGAAAAPTVAADDPWSAETPF